MEIFEYGSKTCASTAGRDSFNILKLNADLTATIQNDSFANDYHPHIELSSTGYCNWIDLVTR